MLLQTSRLGSIEIADTEIYEFQRGLPGFKQDKRYVIVEIEDSPFSYLQSVDHGDISFIIVSPFDFFKSYEFSLPGHIQDSLELEGLDQIKIYNVINVRESLATATVNLGAPIILNTYRKTGVQFILPDGVYSIHQPLFGELQMRRGGLNHAGA